MANGDEITMAKESHDLKVGPTDKPEFRKYIDVNIKLVDGHYLARFNYGFPRIFHNMSQLLTAIEVESAKLGPGPTQT